MQRQVDHLPPDFWSGASTPMLQSYDEAQPRLLYPHDMQFIPNELNYQHLNLFYLDPIAGDEWYEAMLHTSGPSLSETSSVFTSLPAQTQGLDLPQSPLSTPLRRRSDSSPYTCPSLGCERRYRFDFHSTFFISFHYYYIFWFLELRHSQCPHCHVFHHFPLNRGSFTFRCLG